MRNDLACILTFGITLGAVTAGCAEGTPNGTPIDSAPVCMLGTASDCGRCGNACPGMDDARTRRTCTTATSAGTCDVICRGEFYDVDGDAANGCEAMDPPPVQDTAAKAAEITLPNVTGGTGPCTNANNPCTTTSVIYSDIRVHEDAPIMRRLGREDWYHVTATGAGTANKVTACLNIGNYPAGSMYQVCISDAGSMIASTCAVAMGSGGASACVRPPAMPDAGSFYVVVKKMAGTHTPNAYALFLEH